MLHFLGGVYRAVLWPMIDIMCFMDCASGCASSSQLRLCVTVSSSKCAFKSLDMNTFKRTSYSNKNKNMKRQCSFCQVIGSLWIVSWMWSNFLSLIVFLSRTNNNIYYIILLFNNWQVNNIFLGCTLCLIVLHVYCNLCVIQNMVKCIKCK